MADPVEPPKHATFVGDVMETVTAVAAFMVVVAVAVQPLASVAVTVYVPAAKDEIVVPVPPVLQAKVMAPVPPAPDAVADPVPPLHEGCVGVTLTVTAVGCVTTAVAVAVQPLASVAVTVYVAAVSDEIVVPVPPVLHAKVMAPVPPEPDAVAEPVAPPLHVAPVGVAVTDNPEAGWVMATVAEPVHPLASVAVTVYVPAVKPEMLVPDPPVFHAKVTVPAPPVALAPATPVFPPKQSTCVVAVAVATTVDPEEMIVT